MGDHSAQEAHAVVLGAALRRREPVRDRLAPEPVLRHVVVVVAVAAAARALHEGVLVLGVDEGDEDAGGVGAAAWRGGAWGLCTGTTYGISSA